ncbi:MAG: PKD domain-containing protein [Methanobacteriota archaeon]
MKRDLLELLLGIGVLALGLAVVLFTFAQALALAQDPGGFLQGQLPAQPGRGPTSSFDWASNGLDVTFTDTSQAGDGAIVTWSWDFGDGVQSGAQSPVHRYPADGAYNATLVVEGAGGERSLSLASVGVASTVVRSGRSFEDPASNLNVNFNLSGILLPFAVAFLTFGMYVVMALAGGMVTKAGWNLVKPKPETIRVRLKPAHLTQAVEADAAGAMVPAPPPPKA